MPHQRENNQKAMEWCEVQRNVPDRVQLILIEFTWFHLLSWKEDFPFMKGIEIREPSETNTLEWTYNAITCKLKTKRKFGNGVNRVTWIGMKWGAVERTKQYYDPKMIVWSFPTLVLSPMLTVSMTATIIIHTHNNADTYDNTHLLIIITAEKRRLMKYPSTLMGLLSMCQTSH